MNLWICDEFDAVRVCVLEFFLENWSKRLRFWSWRRRERIVNGVFGDVSMDEWYLTLTVMTGLIYSWHMEYLDQWNLDMWQIFVTNFCGPLGLWHVYRISDLDKRGLNCKITKNKDTNEKKKTQRTKNAKIYKNWIKKVNLK
jgi:hypothetical protein